MAIVITCHDPRHETPCVQPCAGCAGECNPGYLESFDPDRYADWLTRHGKSGTLTILRQGEKGLVSNRRHQAPSRIG
jgi:hypothetical protein